MPYHHVSNESLEGRANHEGKNNTTLSDVMNGLRLTLLQDVADQACEALGSIPSSALTKVDPKYDDAWRTGALTLLSILQKKWQADGAIQDLCCNVWKLVLDDASSFAAHGGLQAALAVSGGLEAIVTAMKDHPNSFRVQESACRVLWRVFTLDSSAMQRFLSDLEGLQVVEQAMVQFPQFKGVQLRCCLLLGVLASHKEFKEDLLESGIFAAVATTLQNHYHNKAVNESAGAFLGKLFGEGSDFDDEEEGNLNDGDY